MRAAFIDRDGVINEERNYVHKICDFILLPGVIDGLKLLQKNGFLLVVVTNQAGIAKGYYTEEDYFSLMRHMINIFSQEGVKLSGIYYCPHHPDFQVCKCRKPNPGMLLKAQSDLSLDLTQSIMIGDKRTDIEADRVVGVKSCVLVASGLNVTSEDREFADTYCNDLYQASKWIVKNNI